MVLNIITDDFDNFYEIQDDLGRLVNMYFLFMCYLFYIDNKMNLGRVLVTSVYFLCTLLDYAIEK